MRLLSSISSLLFGPRKEAKPIIIKIDSLESSLLIPVLPHHRLYNSLRAELQKSDSLTAVSRQLSVVRRSFSHPSYVLHEATVGRLLQEAIGRLSPRAIESKKPDGKCENENINHQ